MEVVGFLLGVLFFILLEAFFAGSEIALVSVDRGRVQAMYKKLGYNFLRDFHENPEDYITLTMLGYTVSIVFASTFYTLAVLSLSDLIPFIKGLEVVFSLSLVVFTLTFGEIIPKSLFQRYADRLLVPSLFILYRLKKILAPVLTLSRLVSRRVSDLLGKFFKESINRRQILEMLKNLEDRERFNLAIKLLETKDAMVSEIARPIFSTVLLEEETTVEQAIRKMKESGCKRLPVYKGRVDELIGYVEIYDLLGRDPHEIIKRYIRPIEYFVEFLSIRDVLFKFYSSHVKMGAVVDERGNLIGIVTLDHIVRKLFEGFAEYEEEVEIQEVEKDKWVMNASVDLDTFMRVVGVRLKDGPYDTLGGYILYHLKRIPKKWEEVRIGELSFKILQVDSRRIVKVMVSRHVQKTEETQGAS